MDQEKVTPTGYCFPSSMQSSLQHNVVSFESHPEIYMEMIGGGAGGIPSSSPAMWKEFLSKQQQQQQPGSSKTGEFYSQLSDTTHEDISAYSNNVNRSSSSHHHQHLLEDDPLRIVFENHDRPNHQQGLSLSLGSSNNMFQHNQQMGFSQNPMQDGFFAKSSNLGPNNPLQIRSSKFVGPAKELLSEFCNLGTKDDDKADQHQYRTTSSRVKNSDHNDESGSSKMQSLYSLDLLELQKRKSKLLQMLEEVDKRYKHYCNQMKAVVSSFEAVAGSGAATVYSAGASKAMSKHFRSLRDGIVGQIKATKKALGEKDISAPGTTRGETPRLRLLDQTLRQQRAYQQMSMMESHPWRPQRGLPERAVSVLRAWLFEHFLHPYPSDVDKHILARQTGLSRSQVSNWFINARVRLWKPMVEEMYNEENKEMENDNNNLGSPKSQENDDHNLQNPNLHHHLLQDQKPTSDQLIRIDSECLSSIINNPEKNLNPHDHDDHNNFQGFGRVSDVFGAVELDFSAFNHHYGGGTGTGGGGAAGNGVSLTLGLQQHAGNAHGVSLAFSPATQNSFYY